MPPKKKRKLCVSHSDERRELKEQLDKGEISHSTFLRRQKELEHKVYTVATSSLTKKHAMKQYSSEMHVPLMFLTILLRLVMSKVPDIRKHGLKDLIINSNRPTTYYFSCCR